MCKCYHNARRCALALGRGVHVLAVVALRGAGDAVLVAGVNMDGRDALRDVPLNVVLKAVGDGVRTR